MLIRFLIKNLFSFKELTEFNMLPGRFNRLPHHVYKTGEIDLLKLNVMYGANGAGKSNMIKALSLLKSFVLEGKMPIEFITQTFKFDKESKAKDVYLGIEFIKDEVPYYYGLTINQGIVIEEELQVSGLGEKPDKNLFLRTDDSIQKKIVLKFPEKLEKDSEAANFSEFLKKEMLRRNTPFLLLMKDRQHLVFDVFKKALVWFDDELVIQFPDTRLIAMSLSIEQNKTLYQFAVETMKSFNTGVIDIQVLSIPVEEYFGKGGKQEADRVIAEIRAKTDSVGVHNDYYEDTIFMMENEQPVAKRIVFLHNEDNGKTNFTLPEESDGTRRLLEYLPIIYAVIHTNRTYIIDEIERSIHPLLIKELIKKFSHDENTKGQLIFSTHESNLLDQEIFRPDEIWFAEKNKEGATEFSALSDFKEHHTLDIRKGYLNGRYGAIPFLGNLQDLNWGKYAEA